ncbi:hypothetical protein TNCV_3919941 [Trichonephila clavipes]|nr:hypothetical protein TNCV_3919941 [Trichonephila clavipes]
MEHAKCACFPVPSFGRRDLFSARGQYRNDSPRTPFRVRRLHGRDPAGHGIPQVPPVSIDGLGVMIMTSSWRGRIASSGPDATEDPPYSKADVSGVQE